MVKKGFFILAKSKFFSTLFGDDTKSEPNPIDPSVNFTSSVLSSSLDALISSAAAAETKSKKKADKAEKEQHQPETVLAEEEQKAFENVVIGDEAMRQAETACKREEANHLKARRESVETDNQIKKWIAEKTFNFMAYWCSFVALMVWMYFGTKQGQVEKEVIIALLGTTTISVVGLVGFIVKGLFGVKEEKAPVKSEKPK
jgi:hypothetical protein